MSVNIPFDIQMEIIKKVYDVKLLIRFRSVSKPWKSFIDSSEFIKCYGARHTKPHSFILRYRVRCADEVKYIRLVENDNNETFKVQQQELAPAAVSPLIKQFYVTQFVGASHGLVCLFCYDESYNKDMVVIWNPSIRKSFGIAVVHNYDYNVFGFGVRPDTTDPTVVKITQTDNKHWHVEVFTLSSGVWNVIPISNLLRQSIKLTSLHQGVVIHRFIYWAAFDKTSTYNKWILVSFDLITKEFKFIDLPHSLTTDLWSCSVSKLRESLVVYGSIYVEGLESCGVWVMEHDLSFKKLFSIGAQVNKILGFRESGEPIFETVKGLFNTLDVYDSCSQQINGLGIDGVSGTFSMGSYKESLLLLDHLDLHIYCDDN
ncbi:probable galacturonosyltransferase 7 isoform X2 [Tanacetum coccineum]